MSPVRTDTVVYPDGYFVDRTYDQLNRLSAIKLNGATTDAVSFSYDPLSRRTNMAFSSGGSVAYDWQLNDDLTGLTNNFVGSSLSLTYGFNAVHQITSQNFSDDQYSWHPGVAGSLAYDPANSTNQYPQVGGTPFVYNANGCLTGDGVWTRGYDTENHLLSSSKPGTDLAFVYDPFHRQAEKAATTTGTSKTRFIYSGWQRIADYDSVSGALQNRYVYGTGLDEPLIQVSAAGVLTFLHANHQGSVLAVTDSAGAVSNRNAYGPFGEGAPMGTTFGYTGQRFDVESNHYNYKRRYYDPKLGRFLQPDPIGYQIEAACGCTCEGGCGDSVPSLINLYEYVKNDPFNYTDPMGLQGIITLVNNNPPGINDDHSWIEFRSDNPAYDSEYANESWGTYQNEGVVEGRDYGNAHTSRRSRHLTAAEEKIMRDKIDEFKKKAKKAWKWLRPCSKFAEEVWNKATGENQSSGFPSTPGKLEASINSTKIKHKP